MAWTFAAAVASAYSARRKRALWVLLTGLAVAAGASAATAQTWVDSIDYTKLRSRVGENLATGAGGVLSIVEGQSPANSGKYFVNAGTSEFNGAWDPNASPVQFVDRTGTSMGISNHATGVATYFFGDQTSIADGANVVDVYEAGDWLAGGVLHYNTSAQPDAQNYRVQNHSWVVYTLGSSVNDLSALRRYDYLIETGDMTSVVGANNFAASLPHHPALFAHSYNAIVVGRSDGLHSRGMTGVHSGILPGQSVPSQYGAAYGVGRYKPDIVAPAGITSHATPMVGSAAALLHEEVAGTDAARSETMRAMLMAGATKQEFANYDDPTAPGAGINAWDRTPTRPLDDVFGAGELNIYNSYLIQLGGQHAGSQSAPTTAAGSYGWDYQDYKGNSAVGDLYYNFEIPAGSSAEELSIILAWNAKVTDTNPSGTFSPVESLQNLDLQFYDSSGSFLGSLLDQSVSADHNVEHIYLTELNPGTYTLKVSGAANWDYGLAWRMATKFDQVSADFDEDGDVDGRDFLTWQRNLGTLLGAAHGEGDADGDGDVDVDDLWAVQNGVMASPLPPLAAKGVSAIPEPATFALAAGALMTAAAYIRRRSLRG